MGTTHTVVPVKRIRSVQRQVSEQLLGMVASGRLAPGGRLPSESALARQFGVARETVHAAVATLVEDGALVVGAAPSGASAGRPERIRTHVRSYDAERAGRRLAADLSLLCGGGGGAQQDFHDAGAAMEVAVAIVAAQKIASRHTRAEHAWGLQRVHECADLRRALLVVAANPVLSLMGAVVLEAREVARWSRSCAPRPELHRDVIDAVLRGDVLEAGRAAAEHAGLRTDGPPRLQSSGPAPRITVGSR